MKCLLKKKEDGLQKPEKFQCPGDAKNIVQAFYASEFKSADDGEKNTFDPASVYQSTSWKGPEISLNDAPCQKVEDLKEGH